MDNRIKMNSKIVITLCIIILAGGVCIGCLMSGSKGSKGSGTVTEAPTEPVDSEAVTQPEDTKYVVHTTDCKTMSEPEDSENPSEPTDSEASSEPADGKNSSQSADSEEPSEPTDSETSSEPAASKKPGKENVKYTLSLDDIAIPKDGKVEIGKTKFTFEVVEEIVDIDSVGPEDFLGDNVEDNILSIDYNRYKQGRSDGTTVCAATYTFTNAPKGKKITIEISKELADRVGMTTNIITITVV